MFFRIILFGWEYKFVVSNATFWFFYSLSEMNIFLKTNVLLIQTICSKFESFNLQRNNSSYVNLQHVYILILIEELFRIFMCRFMRNKICDVLILMKKFYPIFL